MEDTKVGLNPSYIIPKSNQSEWKQQNESSRKQNMIAYLRRIVVNRSPWVNKNFIGRNVTEKKIYVNLYKSEHI